MSAADSVLNGIYRPNLAHILHPVTLQHMVREWLKEDTPNFDYGGFVVGEKEETAVLLMKSAGVLAGNPFFDAVFKELDCKVTWSSPEGDYIEPVTRVATVTGKVRQLLLGERVALNCLSRASGIASAAGRMRKIAETAGWCGEIAGTRKTTPGFRLVEKYSLLVGGVSTHRYDLSSMIMLKDNHIWTAGNITKAVSDARVVGGFSTKVEVECRSVKDATEAAEAGCDVVMLDNFSPKAIPAAAKELKEKFPNLIVEASGGINETTLLSYLDKHVDVVSLSRLTQGYETVDFSLKILKDGVDPRNLQVETT
ncbi:nicotinate-nucleotide pyrophosphorylase [carboxylating]-like [Mizuhopecten yessoensis]|uniref:Nicotinate-nucleotide pyrophosphorylase [carboxylating] n=1 Tax=Mizuhopecten yessoensis TaxID=6573 RepID=A0A210QTU2_MIZYE|nr:nicotinate-nucleotide pyrophosphorylase [carboxylating]-like [Mizuhopecten yessoensis]OWF52161.1 Nicotinate-nucleotide pyrophosphorylase [carboxylating] [Mizuhopecten yessoensis]